jgi:anaerobic magnesium-protoporphyrin IX monomethyl ester cyclase
MADAPAVLVVPPVCDPYAPLAGVPAVAAALLQAGRPVACVDLNLELHEGLADERVLDGLRRDAALERELGAGPEALGRAQLTLPDLAARIGAGQRALRDRDSYRLDDDGRLRLARAAVGWAPLAGLLAFAAAPFSADRAGAVLARRAPLPFLSWLEDVGVPRILEEDPAWVGLSVTFEQQLLPTLVLADLLRQRGATIVVGGFHLSTVGAAGLRADPVLFDRVDAVALGEGEGVALALDQAVRDGRSLDGIDGLATRSDDGGPMHPPDMARLATPAMACMPLDRYLAPATVLPVQTSRGCWFGRCSFCNFAATSPGYRRRPLSLLLDDLEDLAPLADAFALSAEAEPPSVCRELAEGMLRRGFEVPWEIMCRLDRGLNRATLERMAEAGCRTIFFGVEAGSPRINALMRKEVSGAVARRVLGDCAEAGINVVLSAIEGFPGETPAEAAMTRTFLAWAQRELGDRIVVNAGIHRYRLTRGSPVWAEPERFGVQIGALDALGPLAVSAPFRVVAPPAPDAAGRLRDPLVPEQVDRREEQTPPPPPPAGPRREPRPPGHDLLRLMLEACNPEGFRDALLAARARPAPAPPGRPQRFVLDPGASIAPDDDGLHCLHPAFDPAGVRTPGWFGPVLEACRGAPGADLPTLLGLVEAHAPRPGPPATMWLGRLLPRLWAAGILDG